MAAEDVKVEPKAAEAETSTEKQKPAKKSTSKKRKAGKTTRRAKEQKPGAARRPYPRVTIEDALRIPVALKEKNGGNPWPPKDVATALGMSHKTPDFFYIAAASRDFGLTQGSRDSEEIALTDLGRDVVYPPSKAEEEAKLREAMLRVEIFRKVLDYYKGANLPEMQYLGNTLTREFNLSPEFHEEFSRLFKENCAYLKIGSGFSPDQVSQPHGRTSPRIADGSTVVLAEPKADMGLRCFVASRLVNGTTGVPKGSSKRSSAL